ncbi:MAG: PRTRC system ThiF family protein [Bryobacteraceae bacterium]|nr:PRTRC system ThiF family protein [Bryobacteraceae bacterium]
MTHTLPPALLRRPVKVLVVGCGGNGSAIAAGLPYLHQALLVQGHPGGLEVILMDGDVISSTNCVRQPFSQHEIGLSKAVVLISRINLFFGLKWQAASEYFTEKTNVRADIVVGCVDTRQARKRIATWVIGHRQIYYWLDLGNSGVSGQFVLGQPLNGVNRRKANRLRTATELFPEIEDPSLDSDDGPSCSALEALQRQEPFVNPTIANHALALLAQLFHSGSISNHGGFVNVAGSRVQPLAVDPRVWRALRRRGRRFQEQYS